jgi:hypothetical protein
VRPLRYAAGLLAAVLDAPLGSLALLAAGAAIAGACFQERSRLDQESWKR